MVIDADALNIIASEPNLLTRLPESTVLTPHPKEFTRLIAHLNLETSTEDTRTQAQLTLAQKYNVTVVLKGAHTRIAPARWTHIHQHHRQRGMAKGGGGDTH